MARLPVEASCAHEQCMAKKRLRLEPEQHRCCGTHDCPEEP